ncbi:MAG: glycosyltransferase [Halalkalicoccus sp.]
MSDPRASVIVPVSADPEGLDRTLSALADQTYADYEVLVVDNASTDETGAVARRYADEFERVSALDCPIRGSYAARNEGIRNADGEILAFLDADVSVDPDWLASAVEAMESGGADYVGCRVEIEIERETPIARYDRLVGFPVETYLREERFAPTACLFVRRSVIEAVGPFDETLVSGGDAEFGRRVDAAGFDLRYEPAVVVSHPARDSLRSFVGKYVRVGCGQYQRRDPDGGLRGAVRFLRRCLPPNPLAFRGRFDPPPSGRALLELYAVDTLRKYAKTAGYLLEGVRSRR